MAIINDPNGTNFYLGTYIVPEGSLQSQLLPLMQAAVGTANTDQSPVGSETAIGFRASSDVFTGTISNAISGATAFENARYVLFLGDSTTNPGRFGYIRTEATGATGLIPLNIPAANADSLSKVRNWATASDKSLGIFTYTDALNYTFQYVGELNNAPGYVFPTNSLLMASGMSGGTSFGAGLRPLSTTGLNTASYALDNNANYSSACTNGASSPTVSELYLRDDDVATGYPAVGYADNLLVARGSFIIGNPYNVIVVDSNDLSTTDPLLGSTYRYYICVAEIGAHYVLMRVGQ